MNMSQQALLIRVKHLLLLAIAILITAEIVYLLQNLLGTVLAILAALLIVLIHWFTGRVFKKKPWIHAASVMFRVLVIFAPLIYLLVKIFVFDSKVLWLQLALVSSFLLPLLLMFYACRLIQHMLDEVSS